MIDVGQVLDKYELLERVGQGGMAVVYRGLDRSLRRTVAVKVLHRHLADHKEARDRFEREAHAVAKLRHENILEIFAYATSNDDAYIVTEFIDGATLKQAVTDHPPQHAEIGAMIVLQVCRALAHAHGQGILHRDVKPENVMIRSDGVVKLTDFGISQMLDLERMTVTGQLLGSPAYMSPEHVEGRQLDFRTDVFAAGIMLYQLTVGKLPFEGKNPHEILKRIGECKFVDPRQANPRVGNELGKIILRAMAREPDDRYPDVTAMVGALERYCDGSGLGEPAKELARYFAAPASYEVALQQRLVDHLTRRGKEQLAARAPQAALELFDRVLTLEPRNEAVLGILDRMAARRRGVKLAAVAGGVLAVAVVAWYARRLLWTPTVAVVEPPPPPGGDRVGADRTNLALITPDAAPAREGAGDAPNGGAGGAGGAAVATLATDAGAAGLTVPTGALHPHDGGRHGGVDAGAGPAAAERTVLVHVSPPDSEVSIAGGLYQSYEAGRVPVKVGAAPIVVTARNLGCCEEEKRTVTPADAEAGKDLLLDLGYLPGAVIASCAVADVEVTVDGKRAALGAAVPIMFGHTTQSQRTVKVEFYSATAGVDPQSVPVHYKQTVEVACKLH